MENLNESTNRMKQLMGYKTHKVLSEQTKIDKNITEQAAETQDITGPFALAGALHDCYVYEYDPSTQNVQKYKSTGEKDHFYEYAGDNNWGGSTTQDAKFRKAIDKFMNSGFKGGAFKAKPWQGAEQAAADITNALDTIGRQYCGGKKVALCGGKIDSFENKPKGKISVMYKNNAPFSKAPVKVQLQIMEDVDSSVQSFDIFGGTPIDGRISNSSFDTDFVNTSETELKLEFDSTDGGGDAFDNYEAGSKFLFAIVPMISATEENDKCDTITTPPFTKCLYGTDGLIGCEPIKDEPMAYIPNQTAKVDTTKPSGLSTDLGGEIDRRGSQGSF